MGDQNRPSQNASSFFHLIQTSTLEWKYQGGKEKLPQIYVKYIDLSKILLKIFVCVKKISGTALFEN